MNRVVVVILAALLLGACAGAEGARDPLRVFAAASLTDAFTQAAAAFEEASGHQVEVSFAGSQTLLTQLSEGADADVLATADEASMQSALDENLVAAPVIFATNRLVVIVPVDNPGEVAGVEDLVRPDLKLVLAGEAVPAGRYAREALAELGLEGALRNVVSEEEDVKGVVGKVASGEADAGITYATDLTPELDDRLRSYPIEVPVDIRYPIALTPDAGRTAEEFVDFVVSGGGASILRNAGFGAP